MTPDWHVIVFPLAIYFIQICEPEVGVSKNDLEMSLIHR